MKYVHERLNLLEIEGAQNKQQVIDLRAQHQLHEIDIKKLLDHISIMLA